ncbi:IS200/IS605 family transposase [Streptomyces sp. GC420]|uniref:IS200/IS605 family transposase n=1 Tax=Streptomyces sp. GC420 TaxID=2697568 RepID=UPI0037DA2B62
MVAGEFADRHLTRCEEITRAAGEDFEAEPVESNGEANHVHLLVNFPPKVTVSSVVNSLKGVSSRRVRLGAPPSRRPGGGFPGLVRHFRRVQRLWSDSYFAGSVGGAPLSILKQYIEQQNRPLRPGLR